MQTKIPKKAMPVVKVLRRDVKRPRMLPICSDKHSLRWVPGYTCPMGLHPKSLDRTPMTRGDFPLFKTSEIEAFYRWWDDLYDAKAAVDAVWPRKKPKAAKSKGVLPCSKQSGNSSG